jgi:hypothetical protein
VSCGSIRRTAETRPAHCSQCDERLLIPAGGDDLILLQVEME